MTVSYQEFADAIAAYWKTKQEQLKASAIADARGAGTAGSVRGGKHFDAVAALLSKFFREAGYPESTIRYRRGDGLVLPGYYRPYKQWDLIVIYDNILVAAFELKALGGPSFGNNYNNRVEEALGSAHDLRRAELAKLFPGERPWLGYFFIMEDAPGSRNPVKLPSGSFPVDPVWLTHRSYQQRYAVFCQRLRDEGLYDAVCYITSSAENPTPREPVEALNWRHFSAAINSRISYLRELGIPATTVPRKIDGTSVVTENGHLQSGGIV